MESVWKVKIPAKLPSDKNAFLFDANGVKVKVMLTESQKDLRQRLINVGNDLGPISGRVLASDNNSHLKILPDNTGNGIYWIGDIENSNNVEVGWDSTNYFYDDNFNTWRKIQDAKEITPEGQGQQYDGAYADVVGIQYPHSAISSPISIRDLQKTPVKTYDEFYEGIQRHLRPTPAEHAAMTSQYEKMAISKGGKGRSKKRRKKVIKRRSITKRRRYKSNRRSAKRRRSKRRRSKRRRSKRRRSKRR